MCTFPFPASQLHINEQKPEMPKGYFCYTIFAAAKENPTLFICE